MTLQCNTEYFFYNKDLFEQAGITETPKTFDELLADCKLLQDQEIIPIAMGGDWPILRYFAQVPFRLTGNEYIENAVSGEGSFGEEAGLKGAQFIQDIAQYFQEGWSSADYDTMIDLFASGQAAIKKAMVLFFFLASYLSSFLISRAFDFQKPRMLFLCLISDFLHIHPYLQPTLQEFPDQVQG